LEDVHRSYIGLKGSEHAAEFMTITCECTAEMKEKSPAVVHVDGTARPQLIVKEKQPFIHAVLTSYYELTGISSIVNTSFNIHEEPIVCTPEDAIQGFLESGLDYLVFSDASILVSFEDNLQIALKYLQKKHVQPSQKIGILEEVNKNLWKDVERLKLGSEQKEAEIQNLLHVTACQREEIRLRDSFFKEKIKKFLFR